MFNLSAVLRAAAAIYYPLFGTLGDVVLLTAWLLSTRWGPIVDYLRLGYHELYDMFWSSDRPFLWLYGYLPGLLIGIILILYSVNYMHGTRETENLSEDIDCPSRPLLFPCRTTHSRLFPTKHSFSYSYLLVGIPVGWDGVAGGMISATKKGDRQGWYHIDAADYLARGDGHLGLRGKLESYLLSQGVEPSRYPYAYLATAAKFLGYHFNPISFWLLYSPEKKLSAMVYEVNNTFDERRMYFLEFDNDTNVPKGVIEAPENDNEVVEAKTQLSSRTLSKPLKATWQKDFHVSPFNSRKGGYSTVAYDPLFPHMQGRGPINTTITLTSSKNHAKLVTRIFSEGEAVDPTELTLFQRASFLARWWWVGFVTFPRIVKEAGLLFYRRNLHVWFRPEPLKESVGRHADNVERDLEVVFRKYLKYLVGQSSAPLAMRYVPSGVATVADELMLSPLAQKDPENMEHLEFKVLTPAFYPRFVHYAHDLEAIFSELHENCTVWLSKPELLPKLVLKKPPPPVHTSSYLDYGYFTAIRNLRQRPDRIERPLTSSQAPGPEPQRDIRGFRLSSMDGYVLSHEDKKMRGSYRDALLRLFLAERIAFGSLGVLWLELLILKTLLAWAVVSSFSTP
ncbi:hypothetical protein F4778DRAFT_771489 [Xylariomycetidae sp. FL2044]|nr:hypothetical protein F4778DRAFT_771489 [Xylariomycetidae sp. FL2044]